MTLCADNVLNTLLSLEPHQSLAFAKRETLGKWELVLTDEYHGTKVFRGITLEGCSLQVIAELEKRRVNP